MRLRVVTGPYGCKGKKCPAVLETDRDTYVVQGAIVNDADLLAELDVPEHETVVEVPKDLVERLVKELSSS